MALSNMLNEPRREIIEQVVGVAVFAIFLVVDYFAVRAMGPLDTADWVFAMIMTPIVLVGGILLLWLLAIVLHGLGDIICDVLGEFDADPRPKQRYRRRPSLEQKTDDR